MDFKDFYIGEKYVIGDTTFEVIKKTYHFITFKWTHISGGQLQEAIIRRKPKPDRKDNGPLKPSDFCMSVKLYSSKLYAIDFK